MKTLPAETLRAEDVRGVYLEGGVIVVAEQDDYEVRAPRMYYDFNNDRAIMVDAVLRTYDRRRRAPVVARADELRQLAEGQWSADNVVLSASSFATPTLALASRKAVLTRTAPTIDEQGLPLPATIEVESTNNTLDVAGVPIFWWPHFKGGPQEIPLRGTKTGWDRYKGAIVETTWDIYALLGFDRDTGDDLQLEVDGYTKRGGGAGVQWKRNRGGTNSMLRLYGMSDSGTQQTDAGITQDVPRHERYEATWESTSQLSPEWMLQTQLTKFSDSTFTSVWRRSDFSKSTRVRDLGIPPLARRRRTVLTAGGLLAG